MRCGGKKPFSRDWENISPWEPTRSIYKNEDTSFTFYISWHSSKHFHIYYHENIEFAPPESGTLGLIRDFMELSSMASHPRQDCDLQNPLLNFQRSPLWKAAQHLSPSPSYRKTNWGDREIQAKMIQSIRDKTGLWHGSPSSFQAITYLFYL